MELRSQPGGITPSRNLRRRGQRALAFLALALICVLPLLGQVPITFRYFYDDTGQLTRVVDSTGISVEYVYDAVGNMLEVKRTNAPAGQLTIFNFTPAQAGPLALVNIQGQGFAANHSANAVRFNGVPTAVLSATADSLSVQVPIGAISGIISVTVGGNTATSTSNLRFFKFPFSHRSAPKQSRGTFPHQPFRLVESI